MNDRRPSLLWPTIAMLAGVALLVALGTWQLQRKAWKDGLLAQIAARVHAAPLPLADALRRADAGEDLEYLRVVATGRMLSGRERFVWSTSVYGAGWNVYVPLVTPDGGVAIVNRGFVADADRDPARRPEPRPAETEIVGLLRKPEAKGLFTPDNDPVKNAWYWRDLKGLARSMLAGQGGLETASVARYFIDAEKGDDATRAPHAPIGGTTLIDLPNNHLQYVFTWYGLAIALIAVYGAYCRSRWQNPGDSGRNRDD